MEIVVAGHLSRDLLITPEFTRETLGGGTAYAMLAPAIGALGAGIVSRVGRDFSQDYVDVLRSSGLDITGLRISGPHTTRFVNEYAPDGQRHQRIEAIAPPLRGEDFLPRHLEAGIVHFSPLTAEEIHPSCYDVAHGSGALISLDVQGYLRASKTGPVEPHEWHDREYVLRFIDILKADELEIRVSMGVDSEREAARMALEMGPRIVVVTRNRYGSTVYTESSSVDIPAVVSDRLVDETGAGDTYMIGFLLEYVRSGDVRRAGLFGATCASFNIENVGPYNMPSREDVEARMRRYL